MTQLDQSVRQRVRPTLNHAQDGTLGRAKMRHCTKELWNTRPFLSPATSSRLVNLNSSVLTRTHSSGSEAARDALWGNILILRNGIMNRLKVVVLFLPFALASAGCSGMVSAGNNSVPVVPSITAQPASQAATSGQAATFTVGASGSAPLTYQWQKNGTAITGAASSTYTTPSTTSSDNGSQFRVIVSNSLGNVTSS